MVSQQQLRQKQLLKPREVSLTQRLQVRREKVFQERQRAAQRKVTEKIKESQSQRDELNRLVSDLTKQIRELEVKETKGSMASALAAASAKYGKKVELSRIKKLQTSIQKGGYYKNLGSLLESARTMGRQTQRGSQVGFTTAIKGSKVQAPDIPKGAKIESIKGGVITYSLPGEVRQSVQEQVRIEPPPTPEVYGPQLPPGYVIPTEPKKVPIVQRVFARKIKETDLGQIYVTPSEVSRPDVGGMRVSVPEETVSVLTPSGVREVAVGKTTIQDIQAQAFQQRIAETPIIIPEVYNPVTGTYQAPVYGPGAGGTAYERPPTIQEQRDIQAAIDKDKTKEKFEKVVGFGQRIIESKPVGRVLDLPLKSVIPIVGARRLPLDITIGEYGTLAAKGIGWTAKTAAEGWTDIYGTALKNIPKKNWPGKWVGGEFEVRPKKGTQAWADAIDAGKVIPLAPEKFGKGVETAIKLGTYAVPVVGATYLGSEVFEGAEAVRHPEKEAERIFQEQIVKPYEEQRKESERTLEPGYELEPELTTGELRAEHLPGIIEQVKFGGAVEAGTSLLFLGGVGAFKAGKEIKKWVTPKKEYFGMTEKQWAKHLEALETQKAGDIIIEKEAGKIAKERYKFTRGDVGVNPFTGQPLPQTIKANLKAVTAGLELTVKEKKVLSSLVDKMQFSKLTSKEIKILKDVSKGRIDLTMQLPEKIPLRVGALGDVPKVVDLPPLKYSPWIGKSTARVESIGIGIKGKKVAKQFQFVYQKGVSGKPLKESVEFQIVTSPGRGKVSKFSKIDVVKEARKRVRKVKTPAGDIYVSYDAPLKLPGSTVAKVGKSKTTKLSEDISIRMSEIEYKGIDPLKRAKSIDILKTSPEIELEKLITKKYSKEELKQLFKKGTTIEKQNIIEIINKGKVVDDVPKLILELQKENPILALRLKEVTKKPYSVITLGESRGVSPYQIKIKEIPKSKGFVEPTSIKKTPWSKTFGEPPKQSKAPGGDGRQVLEMKGQASEMKGALASDVKVQVPPKVKFYPEKVEKIKSMGERLKTKGIALEDSISKFPIDFDKEKVEGIKGVIVVRIPRMVGGTGEVVSEYWGKGTYERTEDAAVFMPSVTRPAMVTPDIIVTPSIKLGIGLEEGARVELKEEERLVLIPKAKEKLILEPKARLKEELDLKLIPKVVVVPKEVQIQREKLIPRMAMVPKQILVSEQAFAPRQVPRLSSEQRFKIRPAKPRPAKPRPPKLVPKIKPYETRVSQPLRKPVPKQGYTFKIRRKGKWERGKVPYAFATEEGAEAFAQKRVLSEAAASYKVVKAKKGKKVIRTRLKVSPYRKVLFRPGKEPGVKVQKKKLRILTPGEKKEISYAGGVAKMKKAKTSFLKQPLKKKAKKKGGKK